jgi:GT2 family glycosyltransferase
VRVDDELVISVIIPCHGEAPLREQLRSLESQDYGGRWEVLVADNGMAPATRAVVASFADDPRLRVVDTTARPGKSYAVNHAVSQAVGTHLVFLDADDVVDAGYVRHLAAALAEHDFVGARMDSRALNPEWIRDRRAPLQEDGLEVLLGHRPVVVGAAMAMSRAAYEAVGGFDESLRTQVDLDLSWRLQRAGHTPVFVPDAVVRYRYRQDVAGVFRQERSYGRGEVALFVKHRDDGVPPRSPRRMARSWLDVALSLAGVFTRAGRARLATTAGAAAGRLEGSVRHRVLYL